MTLLGIQARLRHLPTPAGVLKRVALWFLCGCIVLGGYAATKAEPFASARLLPMTALDEAIPFAPWTVWLYGTVTWVSLLAWLCVPDSREGRRLFLATIGAAAICWVGFAVFPTTYPRELFPVPDPTSYTGRELLDLRAADSPTNCLPSMHVALATAIGGWAFGTRRGPLFRWGFLVWAVVVSVCTLTTKQHYVVDVPSGAAAGLAALMLARWATARRKRGQGTLVVEAVDREAVARLRAKVEAHQWSLDDIAWPTGPLPALDPKMVRLLNEIIYIEEIAGFNFALLRDATRDDDLRVCYQAFADEERRHADGLRHILALHGASIRSPGLGNTLVLEQFDSLDPDDVLDALLVLVSNPVFETFLDAGSIPFLKAHPALRSPAFDAFVAKVCRDEAAHMGLNWILTRARARGSSGLGSLRLLLNPSIYRGMIAVPFMSLDVYSLAYCLGYDYATLLPPFKKLWRLHRRFPELRTYPLWWLFRAFVLLGAGATYVSLALQKWRLFCGPVWPVLTRGTDGAARFLFGARVLRKRGLPPVGPAPGLAARPHAASSDVRGAAPAR